MKIANEKVATFTYEMMNQDGDVLDSSGEEPLIYLHGLGNIVLGLENALEGKEAGDAFKLTLGPEDAYGHRDPEMMQSVSRGEFEDPDNLNIGDQFEMPIDDENLPEGMEPTILVKIAHVEGDEIIVDLNHELAGLTLNFDVKVVEVRDATPVEIEHGHAHYPGDEHSCE